MRYIEQDIPLVVLAGKEYGSGSSRDWAAKGTRLLGVRAVIAESFERIHRSNLVGMGVLPLQFPDGESSVPRSGLTGQETISVSGLADAMAGGGAPPKQVRVRAEREGRRPSSSTRRCESTRRGRPTTSATAGSCSTSCATSSRDEPGSEKSAAAHTRRRLHRRVCSRS